MIDMSLVFKISDTSSLMISMEPPNLPSQLLTPSLIAFSLALKLDGKQKGGRLPFSVQTLCAIPLESL